MMTTRHLWMSLVVAVLIHTTFLYSFLHHSTNKEGAIAQGEEGLYVGVGITGSYADVKEGQKSEEKEILEEKVEELEPEIEKEEDREPEIEPEPEQIRETETALEPESDQDPEPETTMEMQSESETNVEPQVDVNMKPQPLTESKLVQSVTPVEDIKPEQKAAPKPKEQPKLKKKSTTKPKKAKPTSSGAQASRRATGTGNQEHTGGNPSAKQTYLTVVKARIARFKKYPGSARRDGVVGTATVRFMIQRNGRVKQIKLIKSSGDERLDNEALKMLKRASPFPPIPSDVSQKGLDLTLPIEFSLKTIKNKFY